MIDFWRTDPGVAAARLRRGEPYPSQVMVSGRHVSPIVFVMHDIGNLIARHAPYEEVSQHLDLRLDLIKALTERGECINNGSGNVLTLALLLMSTTDSHLKNKVSRQILSGLYAAGANNRESCTFELNGRDSVKKVVDINILHSYGAQLLKSSRSPIIHLEDLLACNDHSEVSKMVSEKADLIDGKYAVTPLGFASSIFRADSTDSNRLADFAAIMIRNGASLREVAYRESFVPNTFFRKEYQKMAVEDVLSKLSPGRLPELISLETSMTNGDGIIKTKRARSL